MIEPADKQLYDRIKKRIWRDQPTNSAYRSGRLVAEYKKAFATKYGTRRRPFTGRRDMDGLTRWYAERWTNQRGEIGYDYTSDVYRPTYRITGATPLTWDELSLSNIDRARRMKREIGRTRFA